MSQSILLSKTPTCHEYSDWEVFKYNFGIWCLGFFCLGCQWTHLDNVPALSKITLDWEDIKMWGPVQKAVVGLFAALIVYLAYSEYTLLTQVGVAKYYLMWIVAVVGFFVWNTKRQTDKLLHVHHYVLFAFLQSIIGYQSPVFTLAQGFCAGVMVEGGARWGYDPIWIPKDQITAH
jgi:hypothetical protein